jgi:hypothetical protein
MRRPCPGRRPAVSGRSRCTLGSAAATGFRRGEREPLEVGSAGAFDSAIAFCGWQYTVGVDFPRETGVKAGLSPEGIGSRIFVSPAGVGGELRAEAAFVGREWHCGRQLPDRARRGRSSGGELRQGPPVPSPRANVRRSSGITWSCAARLACRDHEATWAGFVEHSARLCPLFEEGR